MEPDFFVKRKGQLYVETWHGGLGIKKVADDMIGDAAKAGKETLYLKNASDSPKFPSPKGFDILWRKES